MRAMQRSKFLSMSCSQIRMTVQPARRRPFDVRKDVRALAKHLVLVGGVTILDAIDPTHVESVVETYIHQREASA